MTEPPAPVVDGDAPLILSVDIGTSGARALLYDERLRLLVAYHQAYPMAFPRPGWSEQDPDTVVAAVIAVLRQAVNDLPANASLAAITFSTQMYSVLAADVYGNPLTASLPWSDTRAFDVAAAIRAQDQTGTIPRATGCPIQAIYPLAKIAWLRQNGDLPHAVRFISLKDYVIFRLTGHLLTDWSTASASGLLDIARYQWHDAALTAAGIRADALPKLASPRHLIRAWRPNVREQIGVPADVPIVLGAGDAPLANLGVGALTRQRAAVNVGTSAAARVVIAQPRTDPAGRLWTYVVDEGLWVQGGIVGSGGAVYDWLLDRASLTSGEDDPYAAADTLAATVPLGADGLIVIPYLTGEQSPGWNASARGVMVGLGLHHTTGHLIRATLEGLAFALRRVVDAIESGQQPIRQIVVTGGLNASPVWLRILTDVMGKTVEEPSSTEGSSRGAAMMGWLALGRQDDYAAFAAMDGLNAVHHDPDATSQEAYQRHYAAFMRTFDQFQQYFNQEESHD